MLGRKIISVFLVSCILLLCFGVVNAYSGGNQSNTYPDQKIALECYNVIKEYYMTKYGKDHPENYAGAYIDEEGNLNINLVNDTGISGVNDKELKGFVKNDKVKYHYVKYSLDYLDKIIDNFNDKMVNLDIAAIERDEQYNKVYIYLSDLNDTQIIKIKKLVDSTAIEFKQQEIKPVFTATDLINGTTFSSAGEAFTLGFGARKSDGTIGYVFPGHILASITYNVYIGSSSSGTSIGTVTTKVLGGNCDASFITKSGTTYQPSNKLNNLIPDTYSGIVPIIYGYPQNTALTAWGRTSGKQYGKILSGSYSYVLNGISFTNMVKSDYKAIGGDSGAPVCIMGGTGTYILAGMQSASYLISGSWVPGTSYSIFSKVNNILTRLGCSNVSP